MIEEGLAQELWFNVNVEYGDTDEFNALPDSEKQKRLNMETGSGYLVPDITGNYQLDNFELMMDLESQNAVFWSSKGSYHVEGTEGLFPLRNNTGRGGVSGRGGLRRDRPFCRAGGGPLTWTRQ